MARLVPCVLAALVLISFFSVDTAPAPFRPGPPGPSFGFNRGPQRPVAISVSKSKSISISSGGASRSQAQSSASSQAGGFGRG